MGFFTQLLRHLPFKSAPLEPPIVPGNGVRQVFCFSDIALTEEIKFDDNTYPTRDAPVSVVSVEDVIKSQGQLIQSIKRSIPLSSEECDELLFPVIYNLAELVHLIPASSFYHHKGRGGLFRHSLEVGLYTINIAKTHIFGNGQSAEENFKNTGRWYLACCLAGLLHDVGKVLTSVTVTGKEGQTVWHPLSESIVQWAEREGIVSYNIAWNTKADTYELHTKATPLFFWKLVGLPTRQYLEEANSLMLISELVKALSGEADSQALIPNLVKKADARSTQLDIEHQNKSKVTPGVDTPICSIVEGIITTIIEENHWEANQFSSEGKLLSPLLVTSLGVFLVWKMAYLDIVKELDKRGIGSVPRNADILAEKLCEGGLCEFNKTEEVNRFIWKVVPAASISGVDPLDARILQPQGESFNESGFENGEQKETFLTDEEKAELNAELNQEMSSYIGNVDEISEFQAEESEELENGINDRPGKLRSIEFNFLLCLRLADDSNVFAHVKRPSCTLAVVKGVPVDADEALRWIELTKCALPEGCNSNAAEENKVNFIVPQVIKPVAIVTQKEKEGIEKPELVAKHVKNVEDALPKSEPPKSTECTDKRSESKPQEKLSTEQKEPKDNKKKKSCTHSLQKNTKSETKKKSVKGMCIKVPEVDEKFCRQNSSTEKQISDKEEKPLKSSNLKKKSKENQPIKTRSHDIEKKASQEEATNKSTQTNKRSSENEKDFKDTVAGQRVERKTAQSSESLKPSKGEQIFEVLALGLVKQLKAGKGPMLSNVVLEDGERKTNDDVIAQVLAAKNLSLDGFVTYLERSPDPLLRADSAAHQFCLRIKD